MEEKYFDIVSEPSKGEGLSLKVSGRIDSGNAAAFDTEVSALRAKDPSGSFTMDFSELEYISSAGLRALLKLQKAEKEKIALVNVRDGVYHVLNATGFTAMFDVKRQEA